MSTDDTLNELQRQRAGALHAAARCILDDSPMASDLIELAQYICTGQALATMKVTADREMIADIVREVNAAA